MPFFVGCALFMYPRLTIAPPTAYLFHEFPLATPLTSLAAHPQRPKMVKSDNEIKLLFMDIFTEDKRIIDIRRLLESAH